VPPDRLDDLMRTFVADGKHYTGVDPASIVGARGAAMRNFRGNWSLRDSRRPWHWHLGLRKSFLVYGAMFRKHAR